MRPRCSALTGGFDFSGCADFTSCPPLKQAEISNSEPSTIVRDGIPCIGGLYRLRVEWKNQFAQRSPPGVAAFRGAAIQCATVHPFQIGHDADPGRYGSMQQMATCAGTSV